MSVATYSPGDLALTVNGNIISGFADGSFVKVEPASDSFSKHVGADGEVSRTHNPDESGTVTITLKQTSDSNTVLGALYNQDRVTKDAVVDIHIEDNLGNEIANSYAWIKRMPDFERGVEQTNVEWQFDVAKVSRVWPEI